VLWRRRRDMASMRGPQMAEPTQSMGEWDVRVFALVAQSVYLCVFRRRAGVELACFNLHAGDGFVLYGDCPTLWCSTVGCGRSRELWLCGRAPR